jgi:hypothetical protein
VKATGAAASSGFTALVTFLQHSWPGVVRAVLHALNFNFSKHQELHRLGFKFKSPSPRKLGIERLSFILKHLQARGTHMKYSKKGGELQPTHPNVNSEVSRVPLASQAQHLGTLLRLCLNRTLSSSSFYILPFYYCSHVISKTVSLSSLALLLPVLVNFTPP